MEEIIRRCNLINRNIGSIVEVVDQLFKKSVLTSGGFILTINDTYIQDQNANALSDDAIKKIVKGAKKR